MDRQSVSPPVEKPARRPRSRTADPFDVVRRARYETNEVAVAFSCGKDAAACLELCSEWFERVAVFYMYYVPDLSIHEKYLSFWEARLGDKLVGRRVIRLPHWNLGGYLGGAYFRDPLSPTTDTPRLKIRDIEVEVAKQTGLTWFANGMKKADSLERRAMLSQCNGVQLESHRFYPLAEWTNRSVTQYLRQRDIPLSPEYSVMGWSYNGILEPSSLVALRDHFPEDYEKVIRRFPYAEAAVFRHESGMLESKIRKEA